jgi:Protein of unknown function (DUF3501)
VTAKLTLDDIADLRAYERERDEFRARVIELKKRRRVAVGPVVSIVFENRDTVRFQVQEMARAERMLTDEAIQTELDTYNPLIPEAGHLSATLFIELTDEDQLRGWLPKLVGIERSLELRLPGDTLVAAMPDPVHAAQLTREEITASVHYVGFALTADQVESFAVGPVHLEVRHPNYEESVQLGPATVDELLADLRG